VDTPACLDEDALSRFVEGELDGAELARVEAHLASCASCRQVVADAAYGALERTDQAPRPDEQRQPAPDRTRTWLARQEPRAGASLQFSAEDRIAGKYAVEGVVGSGGMGVVLAARHLELGQPVAIKVLHHDGRTAAARFLREAQTCARLSSDYIPRVFDIGRLPGGAPYIVMERLVGADLARVAASGPIAVADAVRWVLDACAALADAHAAGVVHRDLKPANLFLTNRSGGEPIVKVLDFGISKAPIADGATGASFGITSNGAVMGSPRYMSPEQVRARPDVDRRTDIWSLGVILYELVTGRPPFVASTAAALAVAVATEEPPVPSSLRREVSPELEAAIMTCLAKDPAARFQSVEALRARLLPLLAPRSSRLTVLRFAPRSRRALVASVAGLALAMAAVISARAWRRAPVGGATSLPPLPPARTAPGAAAMPPVALPAAPVPPSAVDAGAAIGRPVSARAAAAAPVGGDSLSAPVRSSVRRQRRVAKPSPGPLDTPE
jgi:eukaryotic-like serine/threonine-protein kinase